MSKLIVGKFDKVKEGFSVSQGIVISRDSKPEYSSLMLIQTTHVSVDGFMDAKKKIGFITGKTEYINSLISECNLKEGSNFSALVAPHKIITLEKLSSEMTESDLGYREKINPETNETLTKGGDVIMWKTSVVAEGSDLCDTLIQHDKVNAEVTIEEEVTETADLPK